MEEVLLLVRGDEAGIGTGVGVVVRMIPSPVVSTGSDMLGGEGTDRYPSEAAWIGHRIFLSIHRT